MTLICQGCGHRRDLVNHPLCETCRSALRLYAAVVHAARAEIDKLAPAVLALEEEQVRALAQTKGLNVHGGLRIRLEYDKESRTILARESAEPGTNVREDVERYIAHLQQQIGFAQAWLIQWRRQQGEAMEAAR